MNRMNKELICSSIQKEKVDFLFRLGKKVDLLSQRKNR